MALAEPGIRSLYTVQVPEHERPNYRLSGDEINDHIGTLAAAAAQLSGLEKGPPSRFSVHEISAYDECSNLVRTVECSVFSKKFGEESNGPEELTQEYEDYEANSTFFAVIDSHKLALLGAIRVARESARGFKTLVDINDSNIVKVPQGFTEDISPQAIYDREGINPHSTLDMMTLVSPEEFRYGPWSIGVQGSLYHEALEFTKRHEITHWLIMLDSRARQGIHQIGIPFKPIMPPVEYLGSEETYPEWLVTSEIEPSMEKRNCELKAEIAAGIKKKALARVNEGMLYGHNFKGNLQIVR